MVVVARSSFRFSPTATIMPSLLSIATVFSLLLFHISSLQHHRAWELNPSILHDATSPDDMLFAEPTLSASTHPLDEPDLQTTDPPSRFSLVHTSIGLDKLSSDIMTGEVISECLCSLCSTVSDDDMCSMLLRDPPSLEWSFDHVFDVTKQKSALTRVLLDGRSALTGVFTLSRVFLGWKSALTWVPQSEKMQCHCIHKPLQLCIPFLKVWIS